MLGSGDEPHIFAHLSLVVCVCVCVCFLSGLPVIFLLLMRSDYYCQFSLKGFSGCLMTETLIKAPIRAFIWCFGY